MTTQATIATIVYPETDGMPLPDGEYQAPIYRRVVVALEAHFNNVPGARVNGDTFIYHVEGDPRRSVSPDCYVALNLPDESIESIERNNVYLLWEVGKAPDFVLEIGSKSTANTDLVSKRSLYARLGVSEYWRYDASGGEFYGEALVGERLVDGEYRRLEVRREEDGRQWGHSNALNLDLWWIDGELRFWEPMAGRWLLTYEEEQSFRVVAEEQADAERVRADAEQMRADAEQMRADAERVRADTERVRAGAEQMRADAERVRADTAEARLAEMKAELRRLRSE